MKRLLLSIAFSIIAAAGFCQQFNAKGFRFEIIDHTAATCKIIGLSQDGTILPETEKMLVIPEIVFYDGTTELKVVEIGDDAFINNRYSDIIIPAGIEKIGECAFGRGTSANSYSVRFDGPHHNSESGGESPDPEHSRPLIVASTAFPDATSLYLGRNLNSNTLEFESPSLSILTVGEDVTQIPAGLFRGLTNIILEKGCQAEFTSYPQNEDATIYIPEDYSEELSGKIVRYSDADLDIERITIDNPPLEIKCGEISQLRAAVYPNNEATVIWTSSDMELLTVDNSGVITANSNYRSGNAVVYAHGLNGVSASAEIIVKSPIDFDPSKELDLFLGETVSATGILGIQGDFDVSLLSFHSSNSNVVSITPQGSTGWLLNCMSPGETWISVDYDGIFIGDANVTVWELPQGMEIDAENQDITRLMWKNDGSLIPVRFTPGHKYVWKNVSASIDNENIADVNVVKNEGTGETYLEIRHKDGGNAVIEVSAETGHNSYPIFTRHINLKVVPYFDLTELKPQPEEGARYLYINKRQTLQMSVKIDNPECKEYLEWQVRNPYSSASSTGIASIDANGLVTAVNYGEVLVGANCHPEFLQQNGGMFLCVRLKVVKLPTDADPDVEGIEVKKKSTFTILIKHWFKHEDDEEEDEDDKKQEVCNDFYVSVDDGSVASARITEDSSGNDTARVRSRTVGEGEIQFGDYLTVEGLNAGTANVTVSSPNGVSVTIPVTVTSVATGLDSIVSEGNHFKVYSVSGVLLRDAASKADIETLPSGAYVIEHDGQTFKVIL